MGSLSTQQRSAWLDARDWPDGSRCSMMDRLYNRLDGMYPTRWRAAFADKVAISNWREAWAEAFDEEGITPTEIKRGIIECRRRHDWPPSLAEFLKACRPPIDYHAAFVEAVEQSRLREEGRDAWSNPAIYWAAVEFGSFDLRNLSYDVAKARWVKCIDGAIAAIRSGKKPDEVPKAALALPQPGARSISDEEARKRSLALVETLAKSKRMPGMGPPRD